jgi:hypothetical protein
VDAFPQDWLRQFAGFQPIAASPEDGESPSAQHYED